MALDPATGDLLLVEGRASLTSGAEALGQKLRIRLRLWAGEWVLNRSAGIPFLRDVFAKGRRAVAEGVFRRAIITCPGVAELTRLRLDVASDRSARLTFEVETLDGTPVEVRDFVAGSV